MIGQNSELLIDLSSLGGNKSVTSSSSIFPNSQLDKVASLKIVHENGVEETMILERVELGESKPIIKSLSNPEVKLDFKSQIQELYALRQIDGSISGLMLRYPNSMVLEIEMDDQSYLVEYSKSGVLLSKHDKESKSHISNVKCSIKSDSHGELESKRTATEKSNEPKVLDIGIILDNQCVQDAGGIPNAIDRVIASLSLSQLDYESLYDHISFNIAEVIISNCASCDPWLKTSDVALLHHDVIQWSQSASVLGSNDLNVFWTGRVLNDGVLGSAHIGSLCTDQNIAVVRDVSNQPWKMRVVLSHEIGHVLGADHTAAPDKIMSQVINNTSSWEAESADNILYSLTESECVQDNSGAQCNWRGDVSMRWSSIDVLEITCAMEEADSIHLVIRNKENSQIEIVENITTGSVSITNKLFQCDNYVLEFTPYCNTAKGRIVEVISGRDDNSQIEVLDIYIVECNTDENGMPSYDIGLHIVNHGGVEAYTLNYKNENRNFTIYTGSNHYIFPNYNNEAEANKLVRLLLQDNGDWHCAYSSIIDEPALDCAFLITEDFNSCGELPPGWEVSKSEDSHKLFIWSSEGPNRAIINYGNASNSLTSKTIDGTCMMVIDDDLVNLSNHSGSTILQTPYYVISGISHLNVEFDIVFDRFAVKGSNSSHLSVQVNQGNEWTTLDQIESGVCHWSNIWEAGCISNMDFNLDQYEGDSIQFRWIYDDGSIGQWTGMAAIDNFKLTGTKVPIDPCDLGDVYIVEAPETSIVEYGNMIYVNTTINVPEAELNITEGAIFYPGTTISQGSRLFVDVEQCEEE